MGKGTLMDMSFVVTNEVDHSRTVVNTCQPIANAVERPSVAVQFIAPTINFSAHQAPTLHPHRTLTRVISAKSRSSPPQGRQVACKHRTPPGSSTLPLASPPAASPR